MKRQLINFPHRLPIIGIAGKARSGKNTAADLISEVYDCVQYSFAAPIKQMVQVGLGLTASQTDGSLKEDGTIYGRTPRQIMQTLGTEWGRQLVNPDIWLITAENWCRAMNAELPDTAIIITDVRFDNEAEWVRKQGGVIIHVRRDTSAKVPEHASEAGVTVKPGVDFIVDNDGSLADLTDAVLEVVAFIESQRDNKFLR